MNKNKAIVVFHFAPIELYPPIINLGSYLSEKVSKGTRIIIVTTQTPKSLTRIDLPKIKIIRYLGIDPNKSKLNKLTRYLNIYWSTLWLLIWLRPRVVIYFETLSSLPVIVYKKLFRKANVFIHYHELVTLQELSHGRRLNSFLNKMERKFYSRVVWISQTNLHRLNYFKKQYNLNLGPTILKILPNYPSQTWIESRADCRFPQDGVLRMLHIGALSNETLYLKEVLQFFGNKKSVKIDFFSHSITPQILDEFKKYDNIHFLGCIDYDRIPSLKGLYNVGLVLYKGISLNVKYCAPNKIFEYLALDLDVWCSDKLITAKDFKMESTYPKIIMVNYESLKDFQWESAINRKGMQYKKSSYFCENIFKPLLVSINQFL